MTTSTTAMKSSQRPRPFLEQWRDAVSGSTAGMVSVLALHPLDVIKTRLQGASPKTRTEPNRRATPPKHCGCSPIHLRTVVHD